MNLNKYLSERAAMIDSALAGFCPDRTAYPEVVHKAMAYSLFAGGKRLRPILCLASAEALDQDSRGLLPVACALEMIHTYSLIHDDLPAMDNDDYRRGKPTSHKVYGEGIAILAGDALLTQAFEILADYGLHSPAGKLSAVLQVIKEIAFASGTGGMIGGQVVDLLSEGKKIDETTLQYIHTHKTGALFRASVRAGALLSDVDSEHLAALTSYAEYFGLAFQITDDLLDMTGNSEKMGKPAGSDIRNAKVTYPSLYGLEETRELARQAVANALAALENLPGYTTPLEEMVRYLLEREA